MNWLYKIFPLPDLKWPETINYEDIERIKAAADVDLCSVYEQSPDEGKHVLSVWEDMLSDVGVTVNVLRLWLGWSDKTLRRRAKQLTAPAISEGMQSLEASLDGFFLALGRGPMFGMLCRVARKQADLTTKQVSGPCERQLEDLLAKTITEKFGDSLASLGLDTPENTNSGNSMN